MTAIKEARAVSFVKLDSSEAETKLRDVMNQLQLVDKTLEVSQTKALIPRREKARASAKPHIFLFIIYNTT